MEHRKIAPVTLAAVAASVGLSCTDTTGDGAAAGSAGTGNLTAAAGTSGGTVGGGAGTGTGGSGTGGSGTGGSGGTAGVGGTATGAGGTAGTGAGAGMGTGGAGGRGAGGSSGAGGASGASGGGAGMTSIPPSGDPEPSAGCTATPTTTSCNTQNAPCTMDVNGTARTYYVELPDNYAPTHPYPVVFEYHPLGGNGWQGLTMYQIRPKMPDAIYVSPDGTGSGNKGFSNTNGDDETLTRDMMADLEAKYCVDKGRYFATGFSFGGSMSYTAACNMSDVFRAIGAMSGAPISGAKCTSKQPTRPVAVWATHGDADTALPIDLAQPIIDSLLKYNGCSSETKSVEPSPCVEYQGCTEGYPVVWCVRPGDPHAIPSFAAAAIAKFFQQF